MKNKQNTKPYPDRMLTKAQAAEYFGMSEKTFMDEILPKMKGIIFPYKKGKKLSHYQFSLHQIQDGLVEYRARQERSIHNTQQYYAR